MEHPTLIERLLAVYRNMRAAIAEWDKERNEKQTTVFEQMTLVEKNLLERLQAEKDMSGLVAFYTEGRDELEQLEAQYKKRAAHVKLRQEKLEQAIFQLLKETKADSMKTPHGTAMQTTQTSVKVADWNVFFGELVKNAINNAFARANPVDAGDEAFIKAVMEDEAFSLLKHAASKEAVKAYVDEHKKPVPGIDFTQWKEVSVRRK